MSPVINYPFLNKKTYITFKYYISIFLYISKPPFANKLLYHAQFVHLDRTLCRNL